MLALLQAATAALLAVALAALAAPSARRRPGTTALLALLGVLLTLVAAGLGVPLPRPVVVAGFAALPPLVGRYAQRALGADAPLFGVHVGLGIAALALALAMPALRVATLTALGLGYAGWIGTRWQRSERPIEVGVTLAVFGVHWALSAASGIAAVAGAPVALATGFEAGSLLALALFAGVAGALGLRRLPALAPPPPAPYAVGLPDADRQRLAERLRSVAASDRPHLDPDLTAGALAERLGASPRELSEVLTLEFDSGFYDYVNGLRVEEAKALLRDPAHADATVLEILYASGFSSKSAFHRAFRAHVGETPSAYRAGHAGRASVPSPAVGRPKAA